MKKKIGIIGASGLTGLELIRVLSQSYQVELEVLNSRSLAGRSVFENFPEITEDKTLSFTNFSYQEIEQKNLDCLFLAIENGLAMEIVKNFSCPVIDLSADFRFSDTSLWEKTYGMKHSFPNAKRVYGLPEKFADDIKTSKLIANPGCYVTTSLLSALPLENSKEIERVVFDGKTGVSGAGRRNSDINNFNNLSENIVPYLITNHRHEAEIQQFLPYPISFTPHVVPMMRGMMVTSHFFFKEGKVPNREEVIAKYKAFYKNSKVVEVFENTLPTPRQVRMKNKCFLGGFEIDQNGRMVIISVTDNLSKGASGQAIQNAEIILGIEL